MDIPDELSKNHLILENQDGLIGLAGRRLIHEHQKNTGGDLEQHEQDTHTAETPGEGIFQGLFRNGSRMDMEDEIIEYPFGAFVLGPDLCSDAFFLLKYACPHNKRFCLGCWWLGKKPDWREKGLGA